MNCYRCGAELPEGAKVCAVCGTPVDENEANENVAGVKLSAKKVTVVAAAMAVIALAIVIAVGKSGEVRHKPPEPEIEPEPERVEHGIRLPASMEAESEHEERESETERETEIATEEASQEGWMSIVDVYKKIECVIPKSFERTRDDWGMTALTSKEGDAEIRIAVIEGAQFENAADALDLMRGEMVGSVEIFAEVGEDWYEAEFADERTTIRRKCFVESGAIRYFEFQYPTERGEYRENIEYMMENFKLVEEEAEEEIASENGEE